MKRSLTLFAVAILLGPAGAAWAKDEVISYSEDIRPIIVGRCLECHHPGGQGTEASGLDLSSYEGLMKGTKFGPMIVPGEPDTSSLMRLIDHKVDPSIRMPHGKKKLSQCDRDAFRLWIKQGAKNN
ncbi:c-type cytochrome domain-containing protein [Phaeospirillum tilakii]|uniref:C-type cytochrome domain-containing protein n=1 Tax=Phaeospirillum tilakii TaxID=741673 RepID=A0ABW5CDI0_9PROT